MHASAATNLYEQVHSEWNSRIDEVISDYGNESLAEQEPVWHILNAVQHNVRKKPHKISPPASNRTCLKNRTPVVKG